MTVSTVLDSEYEILFNFNSSDNEIRRPLHRGNWSVIMDSADPRWRGPGSYFPSKLRGASFVVIKKELR
jgi:hypothetical protein